MIAGHSFLTVENLAKGGTFLNITVLPIQQVLLLAFTSMGDIMIIYFLTNNLCGFRISTALKRIKFVPFICSYLVAFVFFVSTAMLFHRSVTTVLVPFLIMFFTWFFIDKRETRLLLSETLIVALLVYCITHALTFLLIPIGMIFADTSVVQGFLVYSLMMILTVLLCRNWDLNKLFLFISRKTSFIILISLTTVLFYIVSIMEAENIADIDLLSIWENNFILIPFLIPMLIGLVHTIQLAHKNTAIIPEKYHDAKKLLMLLDIKAEKANDVDELKDLLNESITLMNLQIASSNSGSIVSDDKAEKFVNFIKRVIDTTKMESKVYAKIIPSIHFSNNYKEINDIKLAYMLTLLLEYALNTLTKLPIYTDISSSESRLSIRISYEYKFEKSQRHLESFFHDDDEKSARFKIENKFTLSKLKSIAKIHSGKIDISREKNVQECVDYLSICLVFKKEGGI